MQHARLPCPSLSPKVCSNSCPWSRWCHSTVSSSLVPFSFHLQSFPASESFPMSQLFTSGVQSIGVSATSSISSTNECSVLISFRMHWLDLLAIQGTLKSLLQHHSQKASILGCSAFMDQLTSLYDYWENIALTIQIFVGKVTSLLFNMLSRFVIAFLPRSNCLLISWLQALSAVILEPQRRKSVTTPTFPLLFAMKWWDQIL